MTKTCEKCDKRLNCTKLCTEVKKYANQDWVRKDWRERYSRSGETWEFDRHSYEADVSLQELFGGVPYLELIEWKVVQNVKLTDQQSQCLWLYCWENLKQHEIADKLKIRQHTVSQHIDAAKEKLKFYIKQRKDILDKLENIKLTDKQRIIAYLYYKLDYTQQETANEINITRQAVGKSLKIIKRKIDNV